MQKRILSLVAMIMLLSFTTQAQTPNAKSVGITFHYWGSVPNNDEPAFKRALFDLVCEINRNYNTYNGNDMKVHFYIHAIKKGDNNPATPIDIASAMADSPPESQINIYKFGS